MAAAGADSKQSGSAAQNLDDLFNTFATKLEAQSQKREDVQKEVRWADFPSPPSTIHHSPYEPSPELPPDCFVCPAATPFRELNKVHRNVQFVMHKVQSVASDEKGMWPARLRRHLTEPFLSFSCTTSFLPELHSPLTFLAAR
jgi:hypothetical protein